MKVREYFEKVKSPLLLFCVAAAILICLGYAIGRTQRSVVVSMPKQQIKEPVFQTEAGKIDLNSATKEELTAIPGIGDKTADAILEYRTNIGGLVSVDELISINGIGEKKLEAIRPYVTIGEP